MEKQKEDEWNGHGLARYFVNKYKWTHTEHITLEPHFFHWAIHCERFLM